MNIERVKDRCIRREGKKNKRYRCSREFDSIGNGWNIDANPLPEHIAAHLRMNGYITDEMISELLEISLAAVITDCLEIWPDMPKYSDLRQEALVDVIFNMGPGKVLRTFPSFVRAVKRQDWQRAADELKYVDGLKKVRLSLYWTQLHGDPDGIDDGKFERPEEVYKMLVGG